VWEGSSWSARSPARNERARTNELDADERVVLGEGDKRSAVVEQALLPLVGVCAVLGPEGRPILVVMRYDGAQQSTQHADDASKNSLHAR
jgi:hypothetical protein